MATPLDGRRPLYQVQSEGGMWHCSPLAAWTKQDVLSYLLSRGIPYNPVYEKLAALGIPLEQRRVAPLTCLRVIKQGAHAWLKQGWPELSHRLSAVFPAVNHFC